MKKIGYLKNGNHLPALQYPHSFLNLTRSRCDRFIIPGGSTFYFYKRFYQHGDLSLIVVKGTGPGFSTYHSHVNIIHL